MGRGWRLYSTEVDLMWLLDTHLRGIMTPDFKSFSLTGNEDCPTEITLWGPMIPTIDDRPVAVYVLDEGSYRRDR